MVAPSRRKPKKVFTYADYLKIDDDKRYEIIDGELYDMGPAPGFTHQEISMILSHRFVNFFEDRPCKVLAAPFDVRLNRKSKNNDDIIQVVQPDILIVCDPEKLDEHGCIGAPDLIVEILSPSSASRDHIKKRRLYEENGVREYWLVDPTNRIITVYSLGKNGKFTASQVYDAEAEITSTAFPEMKIDFKKVFPPLIL
ncbi:MAG: Uma2 family endonuclease [Candidatus Riflebacteria bacterium]